MRCVIKEQSKILFELSFKISFEQNTRKTRSGKQKEVVERSNIRDTKKADKSLISSYPLKLSKLKGKRLTTFKKKKEIVTPEFTRR